MTPAYELALTFEELSALHKTVGIAIDNLNNKALSRGPDSTIGKAALAELATLAQVQRQILDILVD